MANGTRRRDLLTFASTNLLSFREHGPDFRWIDTVRFEVNARADTESLLASLIESPWYAHTYASPRGPMPEPADDIHGPYRLHLISPSNFVQIDSAEARNKILGSSNALGDLPPVLDGRIRRLISEVLADSVAVFELADLGVGAWHDWGGVVGSDGFLEFAAIDQDARSVTLLVAADD